MKQLLMQNKDLRQRWSASQQAAAAVAVSIKQAVQQLENPPSTVKQQDQTERFGHLQSEYDELREQWQQKCGDPAKIDLLQRLKMLPTQLSELTESIDSRSETAQAELKAADVKVSCCCLCLCSRDGCSRSR